MFLHDVHDDEIKMQSKIKVRVIFSIILYCDFYIRDKFNNLKSITCYLFRY